MLLTLKILMRQQTLHSTLYTINFIGRHIALALLYLGTITGRNLLHTPTGDVLGRRVKGQHIVQILMVQPTLDVAFNLGEVDHHTILIQLFSTTVEGDDPVVTVQLRALALVVQHKMMAG